MRRGNAVMVILIVIAAIILLFGTLMPFILLGSFLGGRLDKPTGGSVSGGGICANISEPYATIFRNAGSKFNVQPAFIGAIFVGEHRSVKDSNYKTWPDPNGPWATSPKGANGPFQFILSTWQGHQQDGDGDGKKDVQNLTDAAFGAAHLLSQNGAGGNTTDEAKLRDSASRYNSGKAWDQGQSISETNNYVNNLVIPSFNSFYCPNGIVTNFANTFSPEGLGDNNVPIYRQGDPRYAQDQTGGKDFSIWGCCPTSAAMVLRYYNAPVDPIIIARLTVKGGYYDGSNGTAHSVSWLEAIGKPFGVNKREAIDVTGGKNWDKVIKLLSENKPLIARGDGAKPYSQSGHCIVLTSFNRSAGTVGVNNPSKGLNDGPFPIEHIKKYTTVVYYLGK